MALNAPYTPNTTIQSTQVSNDLTGLASGVNDTANNAMSTYRSENNQSFVVPGGCVWSGDAYASTRNGSQTSGVVYLAGVRLPVAAVSAHLFTASKDTYVDINTSGVQVYTEATNNAASPALTAGQLRLAIVITGAANIANVGSINQGQANKLLPTAGGYPYIVNDSLGNRICQRSNLSRQVGIGYDAGATLTAGFVTHAQVIGTSDGTDVWLEWEAQIANGNSGADRNFTMQILMDGATTGIFPLSLNFDTPFITGITTNLSYKFTHVMSAAAGKHTWALQFEASAIASVVLSQNVLKVTQQD